jgi:hypothetical protein
MIPIRDINPTRHFPVVNNTLIGINIVVFLIQLSQGPEMNRFIYTYGLVPARYSVPQISAYFNLIQQVFAFISFMFLHGGFLHILFNMWSLYIFGDNVEDRLGSMRYLIFFLACGIASGLSHLFLNWQSNVPTIGASGAIAGVMGAYFILHPTSKILTLIPIIFIPWFVEIPAFVFLGIWFLLQFLNAAGTHGTSSGIAWWAHIGGFVFGMIFLKLFQALPRTGLGERIGSVTTKKKTHRLQVLHPTGSSDSPHLYSSIAISPYEAVHGSDKMVNIPWGFHTRIIRVRIPSGIQEGQTLRLRGLGRQLSDGRRGDLMLRVTIRPHDA